MTRSWVVLAEGDRRRWGGDLRRHYLLRGLADRTDATIVEDWRTQRIVDALRPIVGRRWQIWKRRGMLASAELLDDRQLEAVLRLGRPSVLDIHDDSVLQGQALGIDPTPAAKATLERKSKRNQDAFRWLVAPSRPFAALAGLDPDRVIVASNGTATHVVRPAPWPSSPTIALVSGAAPRRGIEELIAAARIVRASVADVRLDLWLAATGPESETYLNALTASIATEDWITIGQTPYDDLGASLGRATVLAIPTPAHPYWDSVAPIKLFDNLAAGRPVVTTPRTETAAIVRRADAGVVSADDSAGAIAAALLPLMTDRATARRMGANARDVAEREYDWRTIGRRLAEDVLDRVGR